MARQDWDRILDLVKPLNVVDLDGSVEICWPDAECYRSARQPLVFMTKYLTADAGTTLVIGYSERMQSATLCRLQSTTALTGNSAHQMIKQLPSVFLVALTATIAVHANT